MLNQNQNMLWAKHPKFAAHVDILTRYMSKYDYGQVEFEDMALSFNDIKNVVKDYEKRYQNVDDKVVFNTVIREDKKITLRVVKMNSTVLRISMGMDMKDFRKMEVDWGVTIPVNRHLMFASVHDSYIGLMLYMSGSKTQGINIQCIETPTYF